MDFRLVFSIVILHSFISTTTIFAQQDNAEKSPPQYLRLDIDNDALIPRDKTDRYFSSGLKLDYLTMPNPHKAPWVSKIFPKLDKANNYFGYTIAMNMYTPANKTENLPVGDRPYCGWAYVGLVGISNDYIKATRFSTEYSLGAIGPISQQEYIQSKFHDLIGRPQAKGWKNQIANDIAINLSFVGEKRLTQPSDNLDIVGVLETNIGTVNNYMGVGGLIRVGWFEDYFRNIMQVKGRSVWQMFVFTRPVVRLVADNSLLQGGIFTYHNSPYVIAKDDLSRVYMNAELGYGVTYRNFNVTYSQNIRTPEFKDAKNMYWGAMTFAYGF